MRVKLEIMIFIVMLIINDMIYSIACRNQRIKIFVPEHVNHVHHHHVKKVPVYIVTKEKPRVVHASHIEDDNFDGLPRTRSEYDDLPILGIYSGDESNEHENIYAGDSAPPKNIQKRPKIPYVLKHTGSRPAVVVAPKHRHNNFLTDAKHHSRLTFYG